LQIYKLQPTFQQTSDSRITLRPFESKDGPAFKTISVEWISKHWTLEEKDYYVLDHAKENIIDKGGKIYMIDLDNEAVGCCALLPIENNGYEVAKMGLLEKSRGLGLGKKLLLFVVDQARLLGATWLYIESNAVLTPALKLYESVGFQHIPPEKRKPSPYQRCNVFMDMHL
jgi:putative acetyltransferase